MSNLLTDEFAAEMAGALKGLFATSFVQQVLTEDLERVKAPLSPQGFSMGPVSTTVTGNSSSDEHAGAQCIVKASLWASADQYGAPDFELQAVVVVSARLAQPRPGKVSARVYLQRSTLVYLVTPGDFTRMGALAHTSERDDGGDVYVADGAELSQFVSSVFSRMQDSRTESERQEACALMVKTLAVQVEP